MNNTRKLYLLLVTGAGIAMLMWFVTGAGSAHGKGNVVTAAEKLRAYSLTNAPTTGSQAAWSTNLPSNPAVAQVMQQVATVVRTNQTTKHSVSTPSLTGGFRDEKQVEAMRQLQHRVGGSLQVYLRPENSTPMQLKGSPLTKAVASAGDNQTRNEETAKLFLRDNSALLLLNDPDRELQLAHRQTDELGGEILRFTQQYQGLPVWPGEIGVHLDSQGDVVMVDGAYIATPSGVAVQPSLDAASATSKAREAVSAGTTATTGTPDLTIYAALDQQPKLAWKLSVSASLSEAWWVLVDAQSGEVLTTISRVMEDNVSGSGMDLVGTTRPLNVWQSGATYYMIDASKPMFNAVTSVGIIEVDDARGTNINALQNFYYVTSAAANSWSIPDAVSASYNLSQTYDYYQLRFGRSSFNGAGGNLNAIVRIGNYANASWNDAHKLMMFGNVDRYAGSLDVIGHEVTHGVVHSIGSQGVLLYQNQSGALNESFADIFGEMIEARTRGTNDWLIGSELNTVIRNMVNPAAFGHPANMSQFVVTTADQGGVHFNSGIINRAYYLLAAGLKNAVGYQQAESIFYRCLTVSMKPLSQFIDARLGCIAAAETLYGVGSQQALKTAEAFDAVGLFAAPVSAPQPTNVNAAVAAADSVMFIREHWLLTRDDLYRFETARGDSGSGSSLVTSVKLSRPSVSGNGAEMLFVGGDDGLCYLTTFGTNFSTLYPGLVHSVAMSPEGRYIAFVFNSGGAPTNQIILIDLVSNLTTTVNLLTPVNDGALLNNISYADALSFSPDGKLLIYDALSRLRGADGQIRSAWSIFGLDVATLQQKVVVPPVEGFNIGNPSFSKTSSRYVVFDAQYTTGDSAIFALDLYLGTLGVIGTSDNGVGYPVFNGDDTKVFYGEEDLATSSDRSVYVQNLGADKLTTSGNRGLAISDAKLATIYRRGTYPSINTAPGVTLTNPLPNSTFTAPATVVVGAAAGDIDGTVAKVEFYSGDKLLFTDMTAPYALNWASLPAGVYSVYARAYDNQGASSTTPPLRFIVNPPAPTGVLNQAGTSGFGLTLKLPQPGLYRLEASTNLVSWISLGSFYCNTNLSFQDVAATNYSRRFYRAVATP